MILSNTIKKLLNFRYIKHSYLLLTACASIKADNLKQINCCATARNKERTIDIHTSKNTHLRHKSQIFDRQIV